MTRLFPKGLGFLTLKPREQWTESERLLQLVDDERLGAELDKFCGPEFLTALRAAHQACGDGLGLTKAKVAPQAAAVADAFRSLRNAIAFCARRVVAVVDEDEAPESVELAARALEPILEERRSALSRKGSGQPEPEPPDEGELPPVPRP